MLTDPADDRREWFRCFLYADGGLVLTAATEPEAGRELVSSGRLCANARYNSVGYQPWYDHRHDVERWRSPPTWRPTTPREHDYWFYGHGEITSVTGMGNLSGVREMQHTFNSCEGLTEIDLSGLGPSSLEDLAYTFGGCGSLVTIWADADWELPSSGVSGFQTILPVHLPRWRGGHDLRELARGLPVHEDRRRGRRRLPHGEGLLTGTPPARAALAPHVPEGWTRRRRGARDEPAARAARGAGRFLRTFS